MIAIILIISLLGFSAPCPAAEAELSLSLTVEPATARVDQPVDINLRLENRSGKSKKYPSIKVLAGELVIGGFEPGQLKPGRSLSQAFSWRPSKPGRVVIVASAPGLETARRVISVAAPVTGPPDLALEWMMTPPKGCVGQGPWTAQVGVTNQGGGPSQPGGLLLLINDQVKGRADLPSLGPGRRLTTSFSWDGARVGSNTLVAQLDQRATKGDPETGNNRIVQRFKLAKCRPDLVPLEIKLNPRVEAGRSPLMATVVIGNLGGVEVTGYLVRFRINDQQVAERKMGRIGPGQRRRAKLEWMPPRPGRYRLAVEIDSGAGAGEIDYANNRKEVEFVTLGDRPDLVIRPQKKILTVCLGPEPTVLKAEVENQGRRESGPSVLGLRRGAETVSRVPVPTLSPGQVELIEIPWKPDRTGLNRLYFFIDPDRALDESDEDNNAALIQVRVLDCRPDLAPARLKPPAAKDPHLGQGKLKIRVYNRGRRASPPTALLWKVNGRVVGSVPLESLKPGKSVDRILKIEGAVKESNVIQVVADPGRLVADRNRTNNTIRIKTPRIGGLVDLGISGLRTEPLSPRAGQAIRVTAQVVNSGRSATAAEVLFRIDGRPTGRVAYPSLGSKVRKEAEITIGPLRAGRYRLEAVVDPQGLVAETNEKNNKTGLGLTVRP